MLLLTCNVVRGRDSGPGDYAAPQHKCSTTSNVRLRCRSASAIPTSSITGSSRLAGRRTFGAFECGRDGYHREYAARERYNTWTLAGRISGNSSDDRLLHTPDMTLACT